ncbi:ribosomal protein RPS25 [Cardiosporidium cionae]|uniref:40S ribosomal protein S25 n=1 Tax=Cardiosporidium cionae TaxID=476202 RepID=A0ABQ7JFW1_9APIC|nr:ribosomal protein RPS25 [Cardiosporidium cionae]|eukprot:KAF8822901.1 ribosomal protein RPS25 [Cardiosporidium cionae]
MPVKEKRTKEQIAAAAAAGGRSKKKKWSKGRSKEKINNMVVFNTVTYEKMIAEIPKAKLVTPSVICEKLRVNGSLARQAIKILCEKGLLKKVGDHHHSQMIYTRNTGS